MNVNDVITKLKVMLGSEETVEVVEAKLAEATLTDGVEVYTEGELEVGAILFVRADEGVSEDPFAPEGMHATTDGKIITVGEGGEITKIEDEEPAAEPAAEEEVEMEVVEDDKVEMEEEDKKEEKEFDAEGLVEAIAEMLKPQTEVIEELKKELSTLKERFEVVADQPAAKPVAKNTFADAKASKDAQIAARLEMIRKFTK